MFNYIKRTEGGFNPDVSTHVGTNDLSYDKSPEQISRYFEVSQISEITQQHYCSFKYNSS